MDTDCHRVNLTNWCFPCGSSLSPTGYALFLSPATRCQCSFAFQQLPGPVGCQHLGHACSRHRQTDGASLRTLSVLALGSVTSGGSETGKNTGPSAVHMASATGLASITPTPLEICLPPCASLILCHWRQSHDLQSDKQPSLLLRWQVPPFEMAHI